MGIMDSVGPVGTPIGYSTDQSTPAFESSSYINWKDSRRMLDHFYGGTKVVQQHVAEYLPRHTGEEEDDWRARVRQTECFPGLQKTVNGLNGIQWRQPPRFATDSEGQPVEIDPELKAHAEDIDGEGNSWERFVTHWSTFGWLHGLVGVLVDYPVTIESSGKKKLKNAKQEQDQGVRPYWLGYTWDDILSVVTERIGGKRVMTRVVLRERTYEQVGEFGEQLVVYYRIYRRLGPSKITVEVYKQIGNVKPEPHMKPMPVLGPSEIPFQIIFHGTKLAPCEVFPPLLDLGYANASHFRVKSDRRYSLKMTLCPILFMENFSGEKKMIVGPNTAIRGPENSDLKYVEPSGSALGEARTELKDLEADMAAQGLQQLASDTRAAETAEAKRIDREEQLSTIALSAISWESGLDQLWTYHCEYMGARFVAPTVTCETDFSDVALGVQYLQLAKDLVANGHLSLETLWEIMQRAGLLGEDFDPKLELQRLAKGLLLLGAFGPDLKARTMLGDEPIEGAPTKAPNLNEPAPGGGSGGSPGDGAPAPGPGPKKSGAKKSAAPPPNQAGKKPAKRAAKARSTVQAARA